MSIKSTLRKIVPYNIRYFIWRATPKIQILNTYILKVDKPFEVLQNIDPKFTIREIGFSDKEKIRKAHDSRGLNGYEKRAVPRMNSKEWTGLAVIDTTNGDIAYLAWVIKENIDYINEFGISLGENQFFLKDGYCTPEYRHVGLHTRMEQERINYCIKSGANEIFIQIHDSNEKGKTSVLGNGYILYKKNKILIIPLFKIYRELFSAIKKPFKKIIT